MIIKLEDSTFIYAEGGVSGRLLFSSHSHDYLHLRFEPGSQTNLHSQDQEMIFFVQSGQGEVKINHETLKVSKGNTIRIEAGSQRQWMNTGTDLLEIFVVKVKKIQTS
ncbi:MAG: cupin domain-containing protein [Bacteroidales bacterium]